MSHLQQTGRNLGNWGIGVLCSPVFDFPKKTLSLTDFLENRNTADQTLCLLKQALYSSPMCARRRAERAQQPQFPKFPQVSNSNS